MSEHRLEEYLDGLLSEKECLDLEAALARDESLREELARVRKFDVLLAGLHDSTAEERSIRRIVSAAERIDRRRSVWFRMTALAAAVLVGIGVGWMAHPTEPGPGPAVIHASTSRPTRRSATGSARSPESGVRAVFRAWVSPATPCRQPRRRASFSKRPWTRFASRRRRPRPILPPTS